MALERWFKVVKESVKNNEDRIVVYICSGSRYWISEKSLKPGREQLVPNSVRPPTSKLSAQAKLGTRTKRRKERLPHTGKGKCLGEILTNVDTFAQLMIQT